MTPAEEYREAMRVLDAVLDLTPPEREMAVRRLCSGDQSLELRVIELLRVSTGSASDLRTPGEQMRGKLASGDVLLDRFELLELLGEGGMGQVWAASDRQLGEQVAIKLIRPELATLPEAAARFRKEVQLARKIHHPNVVPLYELFEERSGLRHILFLTMERIFGTSLAAKTGSPHGSEPEQCEAIMRQVLAGLAAAHALGIVHRDLKPGNVLLVETPGQAPRALLTDFGLARLDGSEPALTQVAGRLGTPRYMAPEQHAGHEASFGADLYAFALTARELLGARGLEAQEAWSPRFQTLLARCLEFDVAKRPSSAVEAQEFLREDTLARPIEPRRKLRTWGLAALAVAALIAAGGWAMGLLSGKASTEMKLWVDEARESLAEGALVRAEAQVAKAIQADPVAALPHAVRAEIQLEMDAPSAAQASMLRVAELAPERSKLESAEADYFDGVRHLVSGNCTGATTALARHLQLVQTQPGRVASMLTLAKAHERCNDVASARRQTEAARVLAPRNAAILHRLAMLTARVPDYASAQGLLSDAAQLYRVRGNFEGVAAVLIGRAQLQTEHDDLDSALASLDEASQLAHTLQSSQLAVQASMQRGIVERKRGNLAAAKQHLDRALQDAKAAGAETLAVKGLFASANLHLIRAEHEEARHLYEVAREIGVRFRDAGLEARAALSLASLYERTGPLEAGFQSIAAARGYYARIGDRRTLSIADEIGGRLEIQNGRLAEARLHLEEALAGASAAGDLERKIRIQEALATVAAETGDYPAALRLYREARDHYQARKRVRNVVLTELNIADALSALGDGQEASAMLVRVAGRFPDLEPAPGPLTYRWRVVRARNAVRAGQAQSAIADAQVIADAASQTARPQRQDAFTVLCQAYAQTGNRTAAIRACQRAFQEGKSGSLARGLTVLTEAEVLMAVDPRKAAQLAESVAAQIAGSAHVDALRLLSVQILLELPGSAARKEIVDKLSQSVGRYRLLIGMPGFQKILRRADMRSLRAALEGLAL